MAVLTETRLQGKPFPTETGAHEQLLLAGNESDHRTSILGGGGGWGRVKMESGHCAVEVQKSSQPHTVL